MSSSCKEQARRCFSQCSAVFYKNCWNSLSNKKKSCGNAVMGVFNCLLLIAWHSTVLSIQEPKAPTSFYLASYFCFLSYNSACWACNPCDN